MLRELLERDKNGLHSERPPNKRLIVACVHHSLLLASILRYRKFLVRLRAGNASYITDDPRINVIMPFVRFGMHKNSTGF